MKYSYQISVRKPKGIGHFGDLVIDDCVKMCLREIMYEAVDWIQVVQDTAMGWTLVNIAMYLQFA
jgi:hypothetical protein